MLKFLKFIFVNYNFVFSLIGCITGLFGTFLSLFLYFKEKLQLKISHIGVCYLGPLQYSTISDNIGVQVPTYTLNNCVFSILLTISNNCKMPTTINEIILNDKYKLDKYSGIVETIPENLIKKGDHLISNGNTYIVSDYLIPTIELKPFSTLHGYINFFDVPYNIDFNKKIKITFKCVQRNCSVKLKVNPMITKVIQ